MDFYSSLDSRSLSSTPTIFEILSSNELDQLLSPSVRYILVHYAQKYPRYLLKLVLNFDELNLVVRGLLEHHFLNKWNSTFTEKFYGLKRVSKNKINIDNAETSETFQLFQLKRRLQSFQIYGLLLKIVGGEYLKEKLDLLYERIKTQNLVKKLGTKNWRYWYLKLYPHFKSGLKIINVLFQILYISGITKSPSLMDHFLKVEYARLTPYDEEINTKVTRSSQESLANGQFLRPPTFAQQLKQITNQYTIPFNSLISKLSTTLFPTAIFLLKFLEWWNSSEFAAKLTKNSQNVIDKDIPAPNSLIDPKTNQFPPQNSPKCPLCKQNIINPAIIETGYVFCYKCIYQHLTEGDKENGGKCPISGRTLLYCTYLNDKVGWKVEGIRRLMI